MTASNRFGKVYEGTSDIVLQSDKLTDNQRKLFIWLTRNLKSGDVLKGEEKRWLDAYLQASPLKLSPKDVQVVQFSNMEVRKYFGWGKNRVSEHTGKLCEAGVLQKIGEGKRGHSTLYVVAKNGFTPECKPKGEKKGLRPDVNQIESNRFTSEREMVYVSSSIGLRCDSLTCDDVPYPDSIQNNNPSGAILSATDEAEKSPLKCPQCGEPLQELSTLLYCRKCDRPFQYEQRNKETV